MPRCCQKLDEYSADSVGTLWKDADPDIPILKEHFAYCTPEVGAQFHRQRAFRVKMNDHAEYPQILEVIEEVPLPKTARKKKRTAPQDIATS
jgi:hypothetical protein